MRNPNLRKKLKHDGESEHRRWVSEGLVDREAPWALVPDPDLLAETPSEEFNPRTARLIMDEAVEHLQGQQAKVYNLAMRCSLSLAQVGEQLGISKDTARTYRDRAIRFVTGYCWEAIQQGRV